MAGEKTKQIVSDIRDRLQLLGIQGQLKNDYIIYNLLNKYQRRWMVQYHTDLRQFELTLTGETEYSLPAGYFMICGVLGMDNNSKEYTGKWDRRLNKLIVNEPAAGDKLLVTGYIKPIEEVGEGNRVNEAISELQDPIICGGEPAVCDLLQEAVLAELMGDKAVRRIRDVELDVMRIAAKLRREAILNTGRVWNNGEW